MLWKQVDFICMFCIYWHVFHRFHYEFVQYTAGLWTYEYKCKTIFVWNSNENCNGIKLFFLLIRIPTIEIIMLSAVRYANNLSVRCQQSNCTIFFRNGRWRYWVEAMSALCFCARYMRRKAGSCNIITIIARHIVRNLGEYDIWSTIS